MKKLAFVPVAVITTFFAYAEPATQCDLYLMKGSTATGDNIAVCQLTNGQFRYEYVDYGAVKPRYLIDVNPNKAAFLLQKTEDSTATQVTVSANDMTYYIESLTRDGKRVAKTVVERKGEQVFQADLEGKTLEDNVTQRFIDKRPVPPTLHEGGNIGHP